MLFGWDTGLIGGVLTMKSFQNSFGLDSESSAYANLSGNIVSVLQAGCFFGAMSSFYLSEKLGRKMTLLLADAIFIVGSLIQTLCALGSGHDLAQLYVGRVIGGFGVGTYEQRRLEFSHADSREASYLQSLPTRRRKSGQGSSRHAEELELRCFRSRVFDFGGPLRVPPISSPAALPHPLPHTC